MSLLRTINASIAVAMRSQGRTHSQTLVQQTTIGASPTQGSVLSIDDDGIAQVKLADGSVITSYSGSRTVTAEDTIDVIGSMLF